MDWRRTSALRLVGLSLQMLRTYLTGGIFFKCPVDALSLILQNSFTMTQSAYDCLSTRIIYDVLCFNDCVGMRKQNFIAYPLMNWKVMEKQQMLSQKLCLLTTLCSEGETFLDYFNQLHCGWNTQKNACSLCSTFPAAFWWWFCDCPHG